MSSTSATQEITGANGLLTWWFLKKEEGTI